MTTTDHAERRWVTRVGRDSLQEFLAGGHASGRAPRWAWSRGAEGIGSRYITNPDVPGVCVITRNAVALTVITRNSRQTQRQLKRESVQIHRRKAIAS